MKRLLFVFLDGVGLGQPGPHNPVAEFDGPALKQLTNGAPWTCALTSHTGAHHCVAALDATLGIEGLPQSGTGQATLLTGCNCADVLGRHFGPFPHSETHDILTRNNLFRQIRRRDALPPPAFANAFPPQYFEAQRRRTTVTTHCCRAAGVPLRDVEALRTGHALAADITGDAWRDQLELSIPSRSPYEAASVFLTVARSHSLTFFEHFLTDKVGHGRHPMAPRALLSRLDAFVGTLIDKLDPTHEALVLTSDHGNLEDTSHTQHTRNPVPLAVMGWAAPYFADATSLTDVTPSLVRAFQAEENIPPPSV